MVYPNMITAQMCLMNFNGRDWAAWTADPMSCMFQVPLMGVTGRRWRLILCLPIWLSAHMSMAR